MNEYLVKLKKGDQTYEVTVWARDDKQALVKARKQVGKGAELIVVKLVAMAL